MQNEASYYSPSHRDLLGHLGNPAILEYQELPEIVHICISKQSTKLLVMHRLTNRESTWALKRQRLYDIIASESLCSIHFWQTWRQQKPIHEQILIMTFCKS